MMKYDIMVLRNSVSLFQAIDFSDLSDDFDFMHTIPKLNKEIPIYVNNLLLPFLAFTNIYFIFSRSCMLAHTLEFFEEVSERT